MGTELEWSGERLFFLSWGVVRAMLNDWVLLGDYIGRAIGRSGCLFPNVRQNVPDGNWWIGWIGNVEDYAFVRVDISQSFGTA